MVAAASRDVTSSFQETPVGKGLRLCFQGHCHSACGGSGTDSGPLVAGLGWDAQRFGKRAVEVAGREGVRGDKTGEGDKSSGLERFPSSASLALFHSSPLPFAIQETRGQVEVSSPCQLATLGGLPQLAAQIGWPG